MFDHLKYGVRDFQRSRSFYLAALAPLGVTDVREWPPSGAELSQPSGSVSLCLFESKEVTAPLHIAFVAHSREEVDAFHRAALAAGGKDNGRPGLRPQYSGQYYAAFALDPDGHNIEAVFHEQARAK